MTFAVASACSTHSEVRVLFHLILEPTITPGLFGAHWGGQTTAIAPPIESTEKTLAPYK